MTAEPTPTEDSPTERDPDLLRPRIYVASLTDYNAGILHGTWIHADIDPEVLHEAVQEMLAGSPTTAHYGDVAEEVAIHDFEGFGPVHLHEHEALEHVTVLARGIARHGEAFAAWWSHQDDPASSDHADSPDARFQEAYVGAYETTTDYGQQLLDDYGVTDLSDLSGIPEPFRAYVSIDVDGFLRDLQIGGDIYTVETGDGVHVFWGNQ